MRGAPERIRTSRLLLRRPVRRDLDGIFARYASDPEVTRYLSWPRHRSLADTEVFLRFSDSEWQQYRCGPYLAFSLASGELLGATGLTLLQADVAETGYVLARDAWGRGYATECLRSMVDLARRLGVRSLRAQCHAAHHASVHVLEKAGFVLERRIAAAQTFPNLDPRCHDVLSYRLKVGS